MSENNLYEVTLHDGQRFNVQTPHHHDNHDDQSWRKHLTDILKSSVSGLVVQGIRASNGSAHRARKSWSPPSSPFPARQATSARRRSSSALCRSRSSAKRLEAIHCRLITAAYPRPAR